MAKKSKSKQKGVSVGDRINLSEPERVEYTFNGADLVSVVPSGLDLVVVKDRPRPFFAVDRTVALATAKALVSDGKAKIVTSSNQDGAEASE